MPLPNLPTLPQQTQANPASTDNNQVARAENAQIPNGAASADTASAGGASASAQAELQQAENRTGLSDAQLAQLQQAQDKLAAGESESALALLQALNSQLQTETRSYVVQEGESLWHVAGQSKVYGNSYLWPLVWQANKSKVKQPYQLYKGMHLTIPAHPTVQEVSTALAYSKSNSPQGMRPATGQ
jgi:nucleoid-associated protein YgaU